MAFAKEGSDLTCPVCGSGARLEDSKIIYGKSYGLAWVCDSFPKCDTYVGCHKGTATPLGELANAEIRTWRKKTHARLDPLWKSKKYNRKELYQELSIKFHDPFHVGNLNVEQCKEVIEFIEKFYN